MSEDVKNPRRETKPRESTPRLRQGEAIGRDGKIVRRGKNYDGDPFTIPEHLKEPGWSYQWNRASVYGQPDNAEMVRMQDNGWTFVDPARMPEIAGGSESKGHIERMGLVLMERPIELTLEAQEEAKRTADEAMMRQADRADHDMDVRGFQPLRRKVAREYVRMEEGRADKASRVAIPD